MSARLLIGTSWKMNHPPSAARAYLERLRPLVADVEDRDLFVLPPFTAIWAAREVLEGSNVAWGAQDVHPADDGAHTGDVSAPMLVDLGCTWVEMGHSERRRDHGEGDRLIAGKVRAALRHGLRPILCVGEREPLDRAATRRVLAGHLGRILGGLEASELERVVVAYEPVWAIGVGGRAADPDHVGMVHAAIHGWLASRGSGSARVIYGGSVDLANASALLAQAGVDGLFVGRAALDPDVFAAIAHARPLGGQ